MMVKQYLLLIHFVSWSVWALAGRAIVTGEISSPRTGDVQLDMYADLITFEAMHYTSYLNAKNRYNFELSIQEGAVVTISHENAKLQVFLEPGDSLHIKFDAWDLQTTIEFEGRGKDNNKYLVEAEKRFQRITDEFITYKVTKMDPDGFKRFMDVIRQKKLAFYYKSEGELQFSQAFKGFALAEIDYWWAHHLMRYRWEHAFYNKIPPPMELPASYFDFLNEVSTNNDAALTNVKYIYFIDQFLAYKGSEAKKNAPPTGRPYKAPKYRGAETYLTKGRTLYYVLANEMYIKCKNKQTYTIGNDIERLLKECTYTVYTDIVRSEFKKANGISSGMPAPDFTLTDDKGQTVSLAQFRGKVVYLDFWATWCPPCTYELLRSKDLKHLFAGKDVVFLYISLDSNVESWKEFLEKHQPGGIHLFAKGIYKSEVAEKYSVRGLPSFFLIDKEGKLARAPAKRSTEQGIVGEITEVLAQ